MDDLKVYNNIGLISDCYQLQHMIYLVASWSLRNKLPLNLLKCKVLTLTRSKCPLKFEYTINNQILTRVTEYFDLVVLFDERLSFTPHVRYVVAQANRSLGFVMRNCRAFTNVDALKTLYFAYVRSKLEYASIIWGPVLASDILSIEKVHRRFLKFQAFKVNRRYRPIGYNEAALCRRFGFELLINRQTLHSLIFLYKIFHGIIHSPDLLELVRVRTPRLPVRNVSPYF